MTLLQPSDVPSRTGINNVVTSEIANHASLTDVNGLHYDSGWIDIVFRTGFTFSGEMVRYRRIGRQVFVRGRVARTPAANFVANTQYIIGDLPANFRPNPLIMFAVAAANGTQSGGRFWIDTAGAIVMQTQNDTSNISLACTFLNN